MTQERAVRTRKRVLDAAAEEFAAHGYLGTKLLDVIERTGMSKGALYGHFSSKEELAATLIEEAGDDLVARVGLRVEQGATGVRALRETMLSLARYLRHDARARSALRLAVEAPHLDPHGGGLVARIGVPLTRTVTEAQAGDQVGARRTPEAIARLLMSMFLGVPHPVPLDDADAARRFDDLWETLFGPAR